MWHFTEKKSNVYKMLTWNTSDSESFESNHKNFLLSIPSDIKDYICNLDYSRFYAYVHDNESILRSGPGHSSSVSKLLNSNLYFIIDSVLPFYATGKPYIYFHCLCSPTLGISLCHKQMNTSDVSLLEWYNKLKKLHFACLEKIQNGGDLLDYISEARMLLNDYEKSSDINYCSTIYDPIGRYFLSIALMDIVYFYTNFKNVLYPVKCLNYFPKMCVKLGTIKSENINYLLYFSTLFDFIPICKNEKYICKYMYYDLLLYHEYDDDVKRFLLNNNMSEIYDRRKEKYILYTTKCKEGCDRYIKDIYKICQSSPLLEGRRDDLITIISNYDYCLNASNDASCVINFIDEMNVLCKSVVVQSDDYAFSRKSKYMALPHPIS